MLAAQLRGKDHARSGKQPLPSPDQRVEGKFGLVRVFRSLAHTTRCSPFSSNTARNPQAKLAKATRFSGSAASQNASLHALGLKALLGETVASSQAQCPMKATQDTG